MCAKNDVTIEELTCFLNRCYLAIVFIAKEMNPRWLQVQVKYFHNCLLDLAEMASINVDVLKCVGSGVSRIV
jgi:hypothetical protein